MTAACSTVKIPGMFARVQSFETTKMPRALTITCYVLISALAAGIFLMCRTQPRIESRYIAHAMGGLEGRATLNCGECFEAAYLRGYRYFEMDFLETSDGYFVGMHEKLEGLYGLQPQFTLEQFRQSKVAGLYTPLDMQALVRLMKLYPDWFLITDFKSNNWRGLPVLFSELSTAGINPVERVIPQIYTFEQAAILKTLQPRRSILTLYMMGIKNFDSVIAFAKKHTVITAITMPASLFTADMASAVRKIGKQFFVHTVNRADEAAQLFKNGTDGIYTDSLYEDSAR